MRRWLAAERLRDQAASVVERLVVAIEQGASLDGRLMLRQAELAQAEEAVVAARRAAKAPAGVRTDRTTASVAVREARP